MHLANHLGSYLPGLSDHLQWGIWDDQSFMSVKLNGKLYLERNYAE